MRARINLVTSDVAVIDDFLTQPDFRALRGYLNSTAFVQGLKGETIWKDDGHDPLEGSVVVAWPLMFPFTRLSGLLSNFALPAFGCEVRFFPANNALDHVLRSVREAAQSLGDIVGEEGANWIGLTAQPYQYSSGAQSSWHTDGVYAGAYILYAHEFWDKEWGGELLFTNKKDPGIAGHFVAPVPNRLVVIRGGTPHKVATVSQRAHENARISVVGFFVNTAALSHLFKISRSFVRRQ